MFYDYWPEFCALYIANFINLVSPGAGFAITVRNSMMYSRQTGLMTGLGIVSSSFIHKAYTFLGFGLVVSQSPILFNLIKYAGCAYLAYLGWQCFTNKPTNNIFENVQPGGYTGMISNREAFRRGFFTDMLNPQASLSFIALVAATVNPATPLSIQIGYGLCLITTSLIWYSVVAIFFSDPRFQTIILSWRHWLDRLMGTVLIGLGIRLALSSAR